MERVFLMWLFLTSLYFSCVPLEIRNSSIMYMHTPLRVHTVCIDMIYKYTYSYVIYVYTYPNTGVVDKKMNTFTLK